MTTFEKIKDTTLYTEALYRIRAHEKIRSNCYLTADTDDKGGKISWTELDTANHNQIWAITKSGVAGVTEEYLLKPLSNPAFNLKAADNDNKTVSGANDGDKKERWKITQDDDNGSGETYTTLNNVKREGRYVKSPKPKGDSDGNRKRLVFEPLYKLSVTNLQGEVPLGSSNNVSSSDQPTGQIKQTNDSDESVTMNFSYELEESSSITLTSTTTLHVGYSESLTISTGVEIEFVQASSSLTMAFSADFTSEDSTATTESRTQKYTIAADYVVPARSIGYMDVTVGEDVSVDSEVSLTGDLTGKLARMNTRSRNSYVYEVVEGEYLRNLCENEQKLNPGFIYSDDLSTVTVDSIVSGQAKLGYASTFRTEAM